MLIKCANNEEKIMFVHPWPNSTVFFQGKNVRSYHKAIRNTQLIDKVLEQFSEFCRFRSQRALNQNFVSATVY